MNIFYNEPNEISYRDVINDAVCSEWKHLDLSIGDTPSVNEFITALKEIGLSPSLLSMQAYHDEDEGLILDYGLRKQIWIPNVDGWDLSYFRNENEHNGGFEHAR